MKLPLYFLLTFALLLQACGSGESQESESEESVNTEEVGKVDDHNSKIAVDWVGTYTGALPCDDCEEIQAEIKLEESGRYSRKLLYKGKSVTPLLSSGKFEWNEAGSEVTLKSLKGNNMVFKVGENRLIYQSAEEDSEEFFLSKMRKADEAV